MSNNQQRPDGKSIRLHSRQTHFSNTELSFGSNAAVEIEAPILETVTDQRRAQLRYDFERLRFNPSANANQYRAPVNNVNSSQEGLDVAQRTGRTQSRIRQFISSTTDDWFGDDDGVVVNRQNTVAMANIGGAPKYPVMSNQPRTAVNTAPVEPNQPIKQPAPKPAAEANLKSSSSANSPATVNNNSILASAKIIKNSPVKDPTPIQTSKPQIHQQKFIENPSSSSSSSKSPVTNKKDEDWILVGSESQASMATEDGVTAELNQINNTIARIEKFRAVLDQANVDLEKLRKLSWNGVPGELRPTVWKMLLASVLYTGLFLRIIILGLHASKS